MMKVLSSLLAVVTASNVSYTPQCSVNGAAGGQVVTLSDGKSQRCMALITPAAAPKPMPVLFWFHGSGGNAGHCGNSQLVSLASQYGFAFICGEAVNGQWDIPAVITDQTGTPCSASDSSEPGYMKAMLQHLEKSSGTYDTSRLFTSGCSMGSAFSGYIANCLKHEDPNQISAFATHSTGLKYKGDGNRLPTNWGECDGCQWWPFAPVKYSDSKGLKACIYDNTGDGDFYKTSVYLSQKWPELGNPAEHHFASGGHCQNIPFSDIVSCLGISGSPSPRPTPVPVPVPTPTPTPRPSPTPSPKPSPAPSPSPSNLPPAACQTCFKSGCPQLKDTASQACYDCVKQHQGPCTSSCVPYPFGEAMSWYCDAKSLDV